MKALGAGEAMRTGVGTPLFVAGEVFREDSYTDKVRLSSFRYEALQRRPFLRTINPASTLDCCN